MAKSIAKAKATSAKSAPTRKPASALPKLVQGVASKTGPKSTAAVASPARKALPNKTIASISTRHPPARSSLPPAPVVKRPTKSELNGEPSAKAPIEAKTVSAKPGKAKSAESRSDAMRAGERNKFPENRPVPPPPVPTEGRPRKNQAGISSKDLEEYRMLLLSKRRELVGDMSAMEREALRSPGASNLSNLPIHMADMGTDNYEQEFTLGLVEKDRVLLREINQGLAKIQDGTYGICEGTGKPISRARLEAQPWARYSIEYARLMERGGIRR